MKVLSRGPWVGGSEERTEREIDNLLLPSDSKSQRIYPWLKLYFCLPLKSPMTWIDFIESQTWSCEFSNFFIKRQRSTYLDFRFVLIVLHFWRCCKFCNTFFSDDGRIQHGYRSLSRQIRPVRSLFCGFLS